MRVNDVIYRKMRLLTLGFISIVIILIGVIVFLFMRPAIADTAVGTCLPIEKGGTGCNAEEMREYLGVEEDSDDSVKIIESGTDADGWYYRKYSDGRYEAEKAVLYNLDVTTQIGEVYHSPLQTAPMPAGMISPIVTSTIIRGQGYWIVASQSTNNEFRILCATSQTANPYVLHSARGTWE